MWSLCLFLAIVNNYNYLCSNSEEETMKRFFILFVLVVLMCNGALCQTDNSVVSTRTGLVKGFMQEGTMAFLGIPYARVERFMPPMPVAKWQGVRECTQWGPQAMQPTPGRQMKESEMSERNSCVLNVWTTDTKKTKPVMVWLHGGGFEFGSKRIVYLLLRTYFIQQCPTRVSAVISQSRHSINDSFYFYIFKILILQSPKYHNFNRSGNLIAILLL